MKKKEKRIGQIIYKWLIILVLGVFALAAVAGLLLQNYFQERQAFTLLQEYIEDFAANWNFNADMKEYTAYGWGLNNDMEGVSFEDYLDNDFLKRLVNGNSEWLTEVSIVSNQGIVTYSSNPDMLG